MDKHGPVLINMIRRTVPKLIAEDLVGVQPMISPIARWEKYHVVWVITTSGELVCNGDVYMLANYVNDKFTCNLGEVLSEEEYFLRELDGSNKELDNITDVGKVFSLKTRYNRNI